MLKFSDARGRHFRRLRNVRCPGTGGNPSQVPTSMRTRNALVHWIRKGIWLMGLMITLGVGAAPSLLIVGSATIGTTLRAAGIEVAGSSPITYDVQWYRNGTAISGATSTLYDTSGEAAGAVLKVAVTSGGNQVESQDVTLSAAAPPSAEAGTAALAAMAVAPAFFDSGAPAGPSRSPPSAPATRTGTAASTSRPTPGKPTRSRWRSATTSICSSN